MDGISTEQTYELFGARVRGFIRSRVADDHTAGDLLQETFLRIHRRIDSVEDAQRLGAWVFQIARNVIVDHYRAAGRDRSSGLDAPDKASDDDPDDVNAEVMGWLPAMIDRLPPTYRDAARMFEIEGLGQSEIAVRLGVSISAVKSRVQRGRRLLKQMLDACCAFELDRRGNVLDFSKRAAAPPCPDCEDCG